MIASLPSPEKGKRVYYTDTELKGLWLCVTGAGSKIFLAVKRVDNNPRRIRLGEFPIMLPEQARVKAQRILSDMASGVNPIAKSKADSFKLKTLSELLDDYISKRSATKFKASTGNGYRQIIKREFPEFWERPFTDITRDVVSDKFTEISLKSNAGANQAMRIIRALFKHAMSERDDTNTRIINENPVNVLSEERRWHDIKPRNRIIAKEELSSWHKATLELENETARDYFLFLLFTGCRREEALQLKWSDVSLKKQQFTLHDTKNHLTVSLPISEQLKAILERRKNIAEGDHVFNSSSSTGHLKEPKKQINAITKNTGIQFSSHDLRRTFATAGNRLVPYYTLKKLLNHKISKADVTAGYVEPEQSELLEATQKISDYFMEIVNA